MRLSENTAQSTDASSSGTSDMLHATTSGADSGVCKSNEWHFCSMRRPSSASPHPKSATIHDFGDLFNSAATTSTGFVGHDSTCARNPAWYASNSSGAFFTKSNPSSPVVVYNFSLSMRNCPPLSLARILFINADDFAPAAPAAAARRRLASISSSSDSLALTGSFVSNRGSGSNSSS